MAPLAVETCGRPVCGVRGRVTRLVVSQVESSVA